MIRPRTMCEISRKPDPETYASPKITMHESRDLCCVCEDQERTMRLLVGVVLITCIPLPPR